MLNHPVLRVLMVNWWLQQNSNLFPLICGLRLDSAGSSVLPVCDGSVGACAVWKGTAVTPQLFAATLLMHVSPRGQREVRNKHDSPFIFWLSPQLLLSLRLSLFSAF